METLDGFSCDCLPDSVRVIKRAVAKRFIVAHHYLGYAPPGDRFCLGLYSKGMMLGVMIFGRPVARYEDQDTTLELTRMCLLDSPKNSESRALSLAERWIKAHTGYRRLIAYSDTAEGHEGTIYKAANWTFVGETKGMSWGNRRKRRKYTGGDKLKFEKQLYKKRGK